MQLDRIEIAGFFHFREPAVLDLRDIPPGLVAIVGANGEGKTRLLDAGPGVLHGPGVQHDAFPSREHAMYAYATERDAYIDGLWSIDGVGTYRTRVNVDGVRRESDALIEEVLADGRRVALNDGKTSTYRAEIAKRFPSKRQLLASAYAAQGRQGSFVGMDQKGCMELFSDLLDMGHYDEMFQTAKRIQAAADRAVLALRSAEDALTREAGDDVLAALQNEITAAANAMSSAEAATAAAQGRLDAAIAARAQVKTRLELYLTAVSRREMADRGAAVAVESLERLDSDRARARRDARDSASLVARALEATKKRIIDQRRLAADTHDNLVSDRKERIQSNHTLTSQAAEVRRQTAALVVDEHQLRQAMAGETELFQLRHQKGEMVNAIRHAVKELERSETELARLQRQASDIPDVPCHGEGKFAACQFLADAKAASERIAPLRTYVGTLDAERQRLAVAEEEEAQIGVQLAEIGDEIRLLKQTIAGYTLAQHVGDLALAEQRIAQYGTDIKESADRLARLLTELEESERVAVKLADDTLTEQGRQLTERLDEIAKREEALRLDMMKAVNDASDARAIIDQNADAKTASDLAQAAQVEAQAALAAARESWVRLDAEVKALDKRNQALLTSRGRLALAGARRREAQETLLLWSTLARAFGRDGLPKLEVDAAGPSVSQLCNDLLTATYGTRFTLEVVTQVPRADGKGMKEEFRIQVFDNQYGGEPRDIVDLSGGERVIVEEALRGAIALYVNVRNQRPIRTCWRDETTGALNPDNVPRYVAMLRRIQQLGGFRHVLFVTHVPEAAELADAQVIVQNGQPRISLRPYVSELPVDSRTLVQL